jgi:hypothetical protein
MIARSRSPLVVVISGAFKSACACLSDSQFPSPDLNGLRALHAGDPGGQFRCQPPVVGCLHSQLSDRTVLSRKNRGADLLG